MTYSKNKFAAMMNVQKKNYRKWLNNRVLDIDFHDSRILNIKKRKNNLTLTIAVDTYWHPGKPFAILQLINAKNGERLIKEWKEIRNLGAEISYINIKRGRISDRSGIAELIMTLSYVYAKPPTITVPCDNFWIDRIETYEK